MGKISGLVSGLCALALAQSNFSGIPIRVFVDKYNIHNKNVLFLTGILGCGESDVVLDRIVGGDNAVKHSIPWQAALTSRGSNFVFCGGTVIDETHIMTAAHCTENNRNLDVRIAWF